MAYTFLRAKGVRTGRSLVEENKIDLARELLSSAGAKLTLPVDHVVVREVRAGADHEIVKTIGKEQLGVDIGPETIKEYSKIIGHARTIIWNGPMGMFELPSFDRGTVELAKCVAASGAVSVVGGGDSEKAIKNAGGQDHPRFNRRRDIA